MTTAVLMTDSWKPAVLHIVPFSNNGKSNIKGYDHLPNGNRKSFPVLAVTRTNSAEMIKRQNGADSQQQAKDNRISCDKSSSRKLPVTFSKKRSKSYPNSEVSDHLVTFQDFNDNLSSLDTPRTISAASVDTHASSISVSLSEPPSNRYLPKPTFSDRGRYFGHNVVKRTTTLTPGEAELQKHRDNYVQEQSQKKNRYKLNVNELPRSTTPINDNDPDKLNMKQVIQFLQSKKSIKPHHDVRSSAGKKYITTTAKFHQRSNDQTVKQRPWSDITGLNSTPYILDEQNNEVIESVSSIRSSPEVRQQSAASRKNVRSSASNERGQKQKRSKIELKSFKLYRFLAFADQTNEQPPENDDIKNISSLNFDENGDKENEVQKKCPVLSVRHRSQRKHHSSNKNNNNLKQIDAEEEKQYAEMEKSVRNRDGSEHTEAQTERLNVPTTANLMHRRARERQRKAAEIENDSKQTISPLVPKKPSTIRLPCMQDFHDDILEPVADKHISNSSDKFVIPLVCITPPSDENETNFHNVNTEKLFQHTQHSTEKLFHHTQPITIPKLPLSEVKSESKKVFVSVPKEMENSPVKLTLRQEKNVTRVQSYMYEIQSPRTTDYPFPVENVFHSPQEHKFDRATVPMSKVVLRQDIIDIEQHPED